MKKINILLITALACSFTFFSCGFSNLQVPKEVKVRTDATYEFSVMNFDSTKEDSKFKVSDYFDLGKILEEKTGDSSTGNGMNIYKYNDGSQFQQFLIHMPLDEIEFDFSESFKDMNFSKDMENFEINKEFEVPVIEEPTRSEPVDLSDVNKQLNNGVSFGGTTGTDLEVEFYSEPGVIDFESISYKSGYFIVTGLLGDTITGSVTLKIGSDNLTADFEDGVAVIDISNKTFTKTGMKLSFTDPGKTFAAVIDEDSKIKVAEGVTLGGTYAPTVTAKEVTFPFTLSDTLTECTITEGSLNVEIKRPGDWAAVIPTYSIDVTGGITANFTQSKTTETYDADHPATLVNGDIKATSTVDVAINGVNLDFENGPSVDARVTISTISAVVKLDDDYETTIDKGRDVPTDITDYVNQIVWNPSGFDVKAVNDLPAGNNITLTFNSDFLKMTDVSAVIQAEGDAATEKTYPFRGESTTTWFIDVPAGESGTKYTTIPLVGEIELPGYSEAGGVKTFKVTNVIPGKKYHLNLNVEPVFDWESAIVKLPEDKTKFVDKMNTGMNKKTLFSVLGDAFAENINIKTIPLYLFANIPEDMRNGMNFTGKIKAYYGNDDLSPVSPAVETDILPAGTTIDTNNALPLFVKNEAGEITNNFGSTNLNFATAMNLVSSSGSLCLDYDIQLAGDASGGIPITSERMKELNEQGKSAVKIDIVLLFSMDFSVNNTVSIDMMDIAKKKDSDLLGRSEPTDTSAYENYLKVVKSAAITVDNFVLPMSGDVALKVDMYKDGTGETKEVGNGKSFTLEVNPNKLLAAENYPLTPDIQFVIGREGETTNFGILRTMPISGKIKLKVKAKGDIPVYPFSEQN